MELDKPTKAPMMPAKFKRQTGFSATNAWRCDFAYDGLSRRRVETDYAWASGSWLLTSESRFVYDGNLVIQERDANNLPQVTYTRGSDLSGSLTGAGGIGGLLARTENPKLNTQNPFATADYFSDRHGNIVGLAYTNGTLAAGYSYDPYGNLLAMSGPLAAANAYRFSSQAWNASAGLYAYLYRFYSPDLQRWLNRDPIGEMGGVNLFAFVENNPLFFDDLFGLQGYVPGMGPPLGIMPPAPYPGLTQEQEDEVKIDQAVSDAIAAQNAERDEYLNRMNLAEISLADAAAKPFTSWYQAYSLCHTDPITGISNPDYADPLLVDMQYMLSAMSAVPGYEEAQLGILNITSDIMGSTLEGINQGYSPPDAVTDGTVKSIISTTVEGISK